MNKVNNEGVMKEAKEGNAKKGMFSLGQQNLFLAPHIPGFLGGTSRRAGSGHPLSLAFLPKISLEISRGKFAAPLFAAKGEVL
jgi:hypothetical protein